MGLSYDVQGNLAARNGVTHRFDFGNRLREVVGKAQYRYDVHGRRIQSIDASGVVDYSMYSQAGRLLQQVDGATAKRSEAIYLGDRLVAQVEEAGMRVTAWTVIPGAAPLFMPKARPSSHGYVHRPWPHTAPHLLGRSVLPARLCQHPAGFPRPRHRR